MDTKSGYGFKLDSASDKIITKYSYGVALLESPFFLVTHAFQKANGQDDSGFSAHYARSIGVAACFWLVAGLFLFSKILEAFLTHWQSFISVLILLTGTNVLYYTIIDGGMSHVFSFFAFSLLLYSMKTNYQAATAQNRLLIGISIGLIIIIRPINILFLLMLVAGIATFLFDYLKVFIKSVFSAATLVPIFLLVIPQNLYWKYAFDNPLVFSYGNEGFSNLPSPPILEYILSPHNGLLPYGLLWLLFAICTWAIKEITMKQKAFVLMCFLLTTYLFSSWWNWNYGCGFGCRSMIEYSVLFGLPLMIYIHKAKNKIPLFAAIIVCIGVNLKLTFSYDQCWHSTDWDWKAYTEILLGPTK